MIDEIVGVGVEVGAEIVGEAAGAVIGDSRGSPAQKIGCLLGTAVLLGGMVFGAYACMEHYNTTEVEKPAQTSTYEKSPEYLAP